MTASNPESDLALAEMVKQEVLQPIRELHRKATARKLGFSDTWTNVRICPECSQIGTHVLWPCETAKLIYSAEELAR